MKALCEIRMYLYRLSSVGIGRTQLHIIFYNIDSIYLSLHFVKTYDMNNLSNEIAQQMFDS